MGQSEPLAPVPAAANHSITLDVVVADKGGHAASGLQQQDFTLLDNKAPQKITSFQRSGAPDCDSRPAGRSHLAR